MSLKDENGYDVLEGQGQNRSATATEHAVIRYANTSLHPTVGEWNTLTLVVDNHFAPSAQIAIELWYALGY